MRIDQSITIADTSLLYLNGDTAYVRMKTLALGNIFQGSVDLEYSRTHKDSHDLDQMLIGYQGLRWQIEALDGKVVSIHPAEYVHNPQSLEAVRWEAANNATASSDERISKAQATYDIAIKLLRAKKFVCTHIDGLDKYAERCKNRTYPSDTSSAHAAEYAGKADPAEQLFHFINNGHKIE
jgi:hypothetical protein